MVFAVERPLRDAVNKLLHGRDHYAVLRLATIVVLLLRGLRKLRRILTHEGLKAYVVAVAVPYLQLLPPVQAKLKKEMQKTIEDMQAKFREELTCPRTRLPAEGVLEEELVKLLAERKELDTKHWVDGKVTGAVYHGGDDHYAFIGQIYAKWGFANPLHPAIHPALRQMDSEVVRMVINMYNGNNDCCGNFTTGGTESIIMAMKAYRDWGRAAKGITDPNIVVCDTAHAAFDKAGHYFGMFVKKARALPATQEVDLQHVAQLIDRNTVAIVGSCCQYPHGTIDPIEDLAKMALSKKVGLHVDCCLGGFLYPFMDKAGFPAPRCDFRVPGVTSISADPHKYGFAPKGASVVLFSSRELRRHMYCYITDWTGGIYATATMTGSRAGGPVAATWAAMCKFGEKGYVETTRQIVGATRQIAKGIKDIDDIEVVGRSDICCVAFAGTKASGLNCYAIADCMRQRFHWDLQTCQNPPCVHLALTLPSSRNVDTFLLQLKAAVEEVKADTSGKYASTAGLYGMAATLPSQFLETGAAAYIDAMADVAAEEGEELPAKPGAD